MVLSDHTVYIILLCMVLSDHTVYIILLCMVLSDHTVYNILNLHQGARHSLNMTLSFYCILCIFLNSLVVCYYPTVYKHIHTHIYDHIVLVHFLWL